jgi:hypothetical protein
MTLMPIVRANANAATADRYTENRHKPAERPVNLQFC